MEDRGRRTRSMRLLGITFCVAGFTAIALGYHGMARVACPDCQFPYLLSGGATGIGLIALGLGLLVIAQIRAEADAIRSRLFGDVPQIVSLPETIATREMTSSNGERSNGERTGEVVLGRSVFHRLDCRLVEGKADLAHTSADAAIGEGFTPCRLCAPATLEASR